MTHFFRKTDLARSYMDHGALDETKGGTEPIAERCDVDPRAGRRDRCDPTSGAQ